MIYKNKNRIKKMLRIFFYLVIFFFILLFIPVNLAAQAVTRLLGDVNADNTVNIVDALMIARDSAGIPVAGFLRAAADVNCDGKQNIVDALMAARYGAGILKNLCKKAIGWSGLYRLGNDPGRMQLFDVNGDTRTDCLYLSGSGEISVYLNDGIAGFREEPAWRGLGYLGNDPARQKFLDADNDGKTDLVHISTAGGGITYLNNGAGGFGPGQYWSGLVQAGNDPSRQLFIDVNNDLCPDWLTISPAGGGVVYLNDGTGRFASEPAWSGLAEMGNDPARQYFADINGDEYVDWLHLSAAGSCIIHLNNGAAGFSSTAVWSSFIQTGNDPARQLFVDIDGNRMCDRLHYSTAGGGSVYLNDGKGGFMPVPVWSGLAGLGTEPGRQRLADVNGDKLPDWIHLSSAGGGVVCLNNGTGGFFPSRWSGLARLGNDPARHKLADIDGDGLADWIHISSASGIFIYLSNSRGEFYDF